MNPTPETKPETRHTNHEPHPTKVKPSKLVGAVKETVGTLTGDARLKAEGEVERAAAVKAAADKATSERMKGAVEEVVGGLQKHVGHLVQNEQMEVDGRAKELHGRTRQKNNI